MTGRFTRKIYDGCAIQQDTKQSTDPLELVLDVTKYVHCNNICKPTGQYPPNAALLVDVESSLWGIDKLASRCDSSKHPFCGPNGCLLTKDPKVAPHITPYACERGHAGEMAVVTTNMQMPQHPGFRVPNPNICSAQGNGYYVDKKRTQHLTTPRTNHRQNTPTIRDQQVKLPIQPANKQHVVVSNNAPQQKIYVTQPQSNKQSFISLPLRNQQTNTMV